jgi:hypothetical protein
MSIIDEITARAAHDDGRLVLMRPLLPGAAQPRVIYATKELNEQIKSGLGEAEHSLSARVGYLHNDLDRFICGELITVGYGREK